MTITFSSEPVRSTWACLEQSLHQRRPVQVTYHQRQRLLCPHALGWKNHRPMLLAYQADGLTSAGSGDPRKRWRCMFVDEIDHVVYAHPSTPWRTADNYNPSRPFSALDHLALAVGAAEFSHSEFSPTSA